MTWCTLGADLDVMNSGLSIETRMLMAMRKVARAPEHLRRECPTCGADIGEPCRPYRPHGGIHAARRQEP